MRTTEVDLQRARRFAHDEAGLARRRTSAEWRAELLTVGLMVDLGPTGGEPVRAVQRALSELVSAEAKLGAADQPTPWSVGGVPPAAYAIIAGTWITLTAVWNSLYGFFGGAVLLGGLAIVGLVHHRRGAQQVRGQVAAARAALSAAQDALRQRVLALAPELFPTESSLVRVVLR